MTFVIAVAYALNLPFYAGSSLGPRFGWRLEHGRLTLGPGIAGTESFYIALNSEGLRLAPAFRYYGRGHWKLTIPLWAPLLAAGAWTAWARWPSRRAAGNCAACGYSLAGLSTPGTVCPECGRRVGPARAQSRA